MASPQHHRRRKKPLDLPHAHQYVACDAASRSIHCVPKPSSILQRCICCFFRPISALCVTRQSLVCRRLLRDTACTFHLTSATNERVCQASNGEYVSSHYTLLWAESKDLTLTVGDCGKLSGCGCGEPESSRPSFQQTFTCGSSLYQVHGTPLCLI